MYKINFFKIIFIPIKRILFLISNVSKFFLRGFVWLFTSKEHTNFSYFLNFQQKSIISYVLANFYEIDYSSTFNEINNLQNLKIDKQFKNFSKKIDLDYSPKWDYRIIPYILLKNNKVKKIFEFGIDQGRIGYLLNYYNKENINSNFSYIGVEKNLRKGILLQNLNNNNIKIYYESLQSYILKTSKKDFQESLIISSTHELMSEHFLFEYLEKNNIYPKYIISDNSNENSSYSTFVKENNYEYTIISFQDPNKFLDTKYIGISKLRA